MEIVGLILSIAIAIASCAAQLENGIRGNYPIGQRISGGYQAAEGEVPYIAGMHFYGMFDIHICGGAIISNRWILTAYQCTRRTEFVIIFFGSTKLGSRKNKILVESYDFRAHGKRDIDLALVKTPVIKFNRFIQSIPLAKSNIEYGGILAKACGWGWSSLNQTYASEELQCAEFKLMNNKQCSDLIHIHVGEKFVCANVDHNRAVLPGDLGGPLVNKADGTLIGISAFTVYENSTVFGSTFMRVSAYRKWIRKMTNVDIV